MIRTDDTTRGRLGAGVDANVEARLPFLMVVILLVFGAFVVRLFQLQIIMGEVFAEESKKNSVRLVRLEAPRGDILDREGRMIATTRPAFGVQVMPSDLRNPDLAFRALGQLLGEEAAGLREQFGDPRGRARFQPVRLAGDLSYDRLASVESHLYALPGVMTDVRPRRHYLGEDLAAHLLGYLGEIQRSQLETRGLRRLPLGRRDRPVGHRGARAVAPARARRRPQRRGRRARARGRRARRGGSGRGRQRDAHARPRSAAGGGSRPSCPDAVGEPPKMGALVAMDARNRRRPGAGLEALLRPQRLRGRHRAPRPGRSSPPTSGARSRTARSPGSTRPAPPTRRSSRPRRSRSA